MPKLPGVASLGALSGGLTGGAPLIATALSGFLESTAIIDDAMTEIAAGGNGMAPIVVPTSALEAVRTVRKKARRKIAKEAGVELRIEEPPPMPRYTRARRGR